MKLVTEAVEKGIRQRFEETAERKKHAEHAVEYGRAYVASYVEFIHYGERIYQDAVHPPSHHAEGAPPRRRRTRTDLDFQGDQPDGRRDRASSSSSE